jgi:hypothetical protein
MAQGSPTSPFRGVAEVFHHVSGILPTNESNLAPLGRPELGNPRRYVLLRVLRVDPNDHRPRRRCQPVEAARLVTRRHSRPPV